MRGNPATGSVPTAVKDAPRRNHRAERRRARPRLQPLPQLRPIRPSPPSRLRRPIRWPRSIRPIAWWRRRFGTCSPPRADKIFLAKKERAAAEAFYQGRDLAPLWLDKGVENARAKAAIARLQRADADGLDINDYKTPNFAGLTPEALAEADLKLTQTVLTYARHLQAGRFP